MAFLGRALKEDLRCLAEELGENVTPQLRVIDLKKIITESENYDEDFVKGLLETIVTTRKEKEINEVEKEKERIQWEKEKERIQLEREKDQIEFEKRKLELEVEKLKVEKNGHCEASDNGTGRTDSNYSLEVSKLMPKFNAKEDDVVLYLAIFERQAKRVNIDPKYWVSSLLSLLPSDIIQLLARESEEKFENYEYIKDILLKRFKLSPEKFRKKFMQHQRNPEKTWREFAFELNGYFEEWIDGLKIEDFDSLKSLVVTDQLKRRVPYEIREHFIDEWPKIVSPSELAEKLDSYESVREDCKKPVKSERKGNFIENTPTSPNSRQIDSRSGPFVQERKGGSSSPRQNSPKHVYKFACFTCGKEDHKASACPNKHKSQKGHLPKMQANSVQYNQNAQETKSPVLTAKISTTVSVPAVGSETFDKLKVVKIRCGNNVLNGIYDSGAQISVIQAGFVKDVPSEEEGRIEIASALGEREVVPLRKIELKIDDEMHGKVPIICGVSKKLVSDMLLCPTAYEALQHNIIRCAKSDTIPSVADFNRTEVENVTKTNGTGEKTEAEAELDPNSEKINKNSYFIENLQVTTDSHVEALKEFFDSAEATAAQEDLKIKHEQEITRLRKTLEEVKSSHEDQIADLRQKHYAATENLNELMNEKANLQNQLERQEEAQKTLEKQLFDLTLQFQEMKKKEDGEAYQAVELDEICKNQSRDMEALQYRTEELNFMKDKFAKSKKKLQPKIKSLTVELENQRANVSESEKKQRKIGQLLAEEKAVSEKIDQDSQSDCDNSKQKIQVMRTDMIQAQENSANPAVIRRAAEAEKTVLLEEMHNNAFRISLLRVDSTNKRSQSTNISDSDYSPWCKIRRPCNDTDGQIHIEKVIDTVIGTL